MQVGPSGKEDLVNNLRDDEACILPKRRLVLYSSSDDDEAEVPIQNPPKRIKLVLDQGPEALAVPQIKNPCICFVCNKKFANEFNCVRHCKNIHGDKRQSEDLGLPALVSLPSQAKLSSAKTRSKSNKANRT